MKSMSAVMKQDLPGREQGEAQPVVVVGTGPVGVRVVDELLQRDATTPIVMYGNEPWEPYNRVRLSSLLAGELELSGIQNPVKLHEHHQVIQHHNCEIVAIDRAQKTVTDRLGRTQSYGRLVLATGSSPHIPSIDGIERDGVYTFRSLNDVQRLIARRVRSRRVVVLGGGLLGLEAACGLQKHHTEVIVVEHASRLMAQQLDQGAAELLHEHLLSLGIQVMLNSSLKRVRGDSRIEGIEMRSGKQIDCDTLVVATGIRPNIGLARDAGISVGRGIRINDQMQTSDPAVYAIGECAEHREKVYGLVAPGFEQAGVAAHCIHDGTSCYSGSQLAARLKVAGVSMFSMGRTGEHEITSQLDTLVYRSPDGQVYRKLVLNRDRLVGVIAYGSWPEINRIQESLQHTRRVWSWQKYRFTKSGSLWHEQDVQNVNNWPASAIVCQCTGVTHGALRQSMQSGNDSLQALCSATGASSVCGSCKPLLAELVGSQAIEPETGYRTLLWTGIIGLLASLAWLIAPSIPYPNSVQVGLQWDLLWREGLIKQISGFSLLGMVALISVISLRKRLKHFSFGDFSSWRIVHVAVGVVAVATLLAHTGFRSGYNLNFLLMLDFVGLLLVGSIASSAIGLQHALPRAAAKRTREMSLWLHILLLWPLPALLGFHILKTYWF